MLHKYDNTLAQCEVKMGANGRFTGYASVFDGLDSYGDTIKAGAFQDTLHGRARLPLMLFGHNPGRVIGKWLHLSRTAKAWWARASSRRQHRCAERAGLDAPRRGRRAQHRVPHPEGRRRSRRGHRGA